MSDPIDDAIEEAMRGGDTGQGTGTRVIDGELYERGEDGVWRPAQVEAQPLDKLLQEMAELGLIPMPTTSAAAQAPASIRDPNQTSRSTFVDPGTGIRYDRAGDRLPLDLQGIGAGGSSDPYAGAANARAERAQAEQIRQNRIGEAMNAIDLQTMRQEASLAGAKFAAPTDTGGYHAGMMPTSPAVRAGLIDPLKFTPVPYNSSIGDEQIAKDLAMLRRSAGVR